MNTSSMGSWTGNEVASQCLELQVGHATTSTAKATSFCDAYYQYWWPQWYPTYHICEQRSKVEQGFKIVGKLLEKKLIKQDLTIKEFIKLVNDIAEIL